MSFPGCEVLELIDSRMNARIRLLDSRREEQEIKFTSQKLIESLVLCGVPLHLAYSTLEVVTTDILAHRSDPDLPTSELRTLVRGALHLLVEKSVAPQMIQHWGDRYVRKYGPVDGKIQIVRETGMIDELDYKYLRNRVLPDVFGTMLNMPENRIKEMFGGDELVQMANQVMMAVRDLGVYRLHYRTVAALIQEIALQPPHPWFAAAGPGFDPVTYNVDHALSHLERLRGALETRNLREARDSFRECIHHATAAVLAHYGESIGATDLAPFYHLFAIVRAVLGKKGRLAIEGSTIDEFIAADLGTADMTLADFHDLLKRTERFISTLYVDTRVTESLSTLEKLVRVSSEVISGRERLIQGIRTIGRESRESKGAGFEKLVAKVLQMNPSFKVYHNKIIDGRQYDLIVEHGGDRDTILSDLRRFIQVECKNLTTKTGREVVEKAGKRVDDVRIHLCNAVMIFSASGFTRDAVAEARAWGGKNVVVLLLDLDDLVQMVEKGVAPHLEQCLRSFIIG
ncbi:MAG: hypothetical protein AVDCRST_MAG68-4326 [uncultured Gemmatimonadetes bacterium]|uniref:Restriction endonuclease type IV Mrr domain-containing protein n=1 Tax=uncultured Gemmatimonadota bacterium TaxID=203437 RepID=A0A6J4MIC9_9BACT|nr:MAG: hypothetical protein AVDCRST_MAG68-4326 [uncultured Gemmatimonadota bacterium]